MIPLDAIDRALLDRFQRDFPRCPEPFAVLGAALGITVDAVIERLARLQAAGIVGRVGATMRTGRAGASCLAALAVPPARLEAVAALIGNFAEVNHSYERTHSYNLWFVVTAPDEARRRAVLAAIAAASDLPMLDLPMDESFHIDLGFPLSWS